PLQWRGGDVAGAAPAWLARAPPPARRDPPVRTSLPRPRRSGRCGPSRAPGGFARRSADPSSAAAHNHPRGVRSLRLLPRPPRASPAGPTPCSTRLVSHDGDLRRHRLDHDLDQWARDEVRGVILRPEGQLQPHCRRAPLAWGPERVLELLYRVREPAVTTRD